MGRFFNTPPTHGTQPSPCDDPALARTKKTLADFSLTISAAGHRDLDRALAVTNAAFQRQIDRHLRSIDGKNAKKRTAQLLNELCATLVAQRLAELDLAKAPGHHSDHTTGEEPGRHDDDGDDLDEPFGEYYGEAADPEGGEEWG